MFELPLLIQLNNPENTLKTLPEGITYKRFTVRVDNADTIVHIPLREAENFKERISETNKITARIFKSLLREFRGIRNIED